MPLNAGWRRVPSSVHSVQVTSQTSSGSHQTAKRAFGPLGAPTSNGLLGAFARAELAGESLDQLLGEARADAAGEVERLGLVLAELGGTPVVVADQQRADAVGPPALAGDVAADHELLAAPDALLDPFSAAPAGPVGAVASAWRRCPRGPEGGRPRAGRRRRRAGSGVSASAGPRDRARRAVRDAEVGEVPDAVAVEVQEVEDHVVDRLLSSRAPRSAAGEVRPMRLWISWKRGRPSGRARPPRRRGSPPGRRAARRSGRAPDSAR